VDEVKKVMNMLYYTLHPHFVPEVSYDGLAIRQILKSVIRVNWFLRPALSMRICACARTCVLFIWGEGVGGYVEEIGTHESVFPFALSIATWWGYELSKCKQAQNTEEPLEM
jgi:hypothetical protein